MGEKKKWRIGLGHHFVTRSERLEENLDALDEFVREDEEENADAKSEASTDSPTQDKEDDPGLSNVMTNPAFIVKTLFSNHENNHQDNNNNHNSENHTEKHTEIAKDEFVDVNIDPKVEPHENSGMEQKGEEAKT